MSIRKRYFAEIQKFLGNIEFKEGRYPTALSYYDKAIDIDASNAIYYTNRALVFQKTNDYSKAIDDADIALGLDIDMLKAHVILIKCQVQLSLLFEVVNAVENIPIHLQQRPELLEQKIIAANRRLVFTFSHSIVPR
jgi:tetratricopeptide (TPR) repeat protein